MTEQMLTAETPIGLPGLEASHDEILTEMARLESASDDAFASCYCSLVAKIECDFHREEQAMEEIDYPGLKNHREHHAKVLGALHHAAPRIMNGDLLLGREVTRALPQWFALHLVAADRALASALAEAGEQLSAALPHWIRGENHATTINITTQCDGCHSGRAR